MQPAGTVTHALSDGDGTLQMAALKTAAVKELANDVTAERRDGAVGLRRRRRLPGTGRRRCFSCRRRRFGRSDRPTLRGCLTDSFNQSAFDTRVWQVADPGSHLGLSAAGLTMTGGNGFDGQTTLTAIDAVEMGGSLVIEAGSLQLGAASAGIVCGLYTGATQSANCFAGYNVRQSGGATVVVPLVNGAEVGTVYTLLSGHMPTRCASGCIVSRRSACCRPTTRWSMARCRPLAAGWSRRRWRWCSSCRISASRRTRRRRCCMTARCRATPASCSFVAVNSVQLFGSMGYCRVTQTGSAWVVSTLPSGAKMTRLVGVAGEGVDCTVSATGKVTFFAGPNPGRGRICNCDVSCAAESGGAAGGCGQRCGGGGGRRSGNGAVAGQSREACGAEFCRLRECGAGGAELFGQPRGGDCGEL